MQVRLLNVDGAPESSLISIKAGAGPRRQSAINESTNDKPFAFATPISESNSLQMNVLEQVGSCSLALRPGEGLYTAPLGAGAAVTFAVTKPGARTGDAQKAGAASASSARESSAKNVLPKSWRSDVSQATEYLDEKGVMPMMKGLLESIIKEQPDDPYAFVADLLAKAREAQSSVLVDRDKLRAPVVCSAAETQQVEAPNCLVETPIQAPHQPEDFGPRPIDIAIAQTFGASRHDDEFACEVSDSDAMSLHTKRDTDAAAMAQPMETSSEAVHFGDALGTHAVDSESGGVALAVVAQASLWKRTFRLIPSVGTWISSASAWRHAPCTNIAVEDLCDVVSQPTQSPFHLRPSVGTWRLRLTTTQLARVVRTSSSAGSLPTQTDHDSAAMRLCRYRVLPSVGSWRMKLLCAPRWPGGAPLEKMQSSATCVCGPQLRPSFHLLPSVGSWRLNLPCIQRGQTEAEASSKACMEFHDDRAEVAAAIYGEVSAPDPTPDADAVGDGKSLHEDVEVHVADEADAPASIAIQEDHGEGVAPDDAAGKDDQIESPPRSPFFRRQNALTKDLDTASENPGSPTTATSTPAKEESGEPSSAGTVPQSASPSSSSPGRKGLFGRLLGR